MKYEVIVKKITGQKQYHEAQAQAISIDLEKCLKAFMSK